MPKRISDSSDFDDITVPFAPTAECTSPQGGRQMMSATLPIDIDLLFNMLFTKSKFMTEFHKQRKSQDLILGEWIKDNFGKMVRTVNVTIPIAANIGPKAAKIREDQELRVCSKPGEFYSIDIIASGSGVPYTDTFVVLTHYSLVRTVDNHTMISIHAQIKYIKSVWGVIKGFIEKHAWAGLDDYYKALLNGLQKEISILGDASLVRTKDILAPVQTTEKSTKKVISPKAPTSQTATVVTSTAKPTTQTSPLAKTEPTAKSVSAGSASPATKMTLISPSSARTVDSAKKASAGSTSPSTKTTPISPSARTADKTTTAAKNKADAVLSSSSTSKNETATQATKTTAKVAPVAKGTEAVSASLTTPTAQATHTNPGTKATSDTTKTSGTTSTQNTRTIPASTTKQVPTTNPACSCSPAGQASLVTSVPSTSKTASNSTATPRDLAPSTTKTPSACSCSPASQASRLTPDPPTSHTAKTTTSATSVQGPSTTKTTSASKRLLPLSARKTKDEPAVKTELAATIKPVGLARTGAKTSLSVRTTPIIQTESATSLTSKTVGNQNYGEKPSISKAVKPHTATAPSPEEPFKENLIICVIVIMAVLVACNVILFYKICNLEDRVAVFDGQASSKPDGLKTTNLPNSHQEWVKFLREQEFLHEKELKKWFEVVQTSIDLLKRESLFCKNLNTGQKPTKV